MFCKNHVFKNFTKFTGIHLCWSHFFKRLLAEVFSYKFTEIFNNLFFTEHLPWLPYFWASYLLVINVPLKKKNSHWICFTNEYTGFYM